MLRVFKVPQIVWLALLLLGTATPAAALPSVAVLPFELFDDKHDLDPAGRDEYARLAPITRMLREELVRRELFLVLDNGPAQALIERSSATQSLLNCNGCQLDIGRALGADFVALGWVQKISNLILNINLRVERVSDGAVVLQKSADLRGNTQESWQRGLLYLLRGLDQPPPLPD